MNHEESHQCISIPDGKNKDRAKLWLPKEVVKSHSLEILKSHLDVIPGKWFMVSLKPDDLQKSLLAQPFFGFCDSMKNLLEGCSCACEPTQRTAP